MNTSSKRNAAFDPVEAQYLAVENMLANGQLREASQACEQLLQSNPLDHRGYYLLSRLFSMVGNTEKSLTFIEKAMEYSPKEIAFYFYLRANGRLLQERLAEAEEDFLKALSLDRKLGLAMLLLGTTYIKTKNYAEAEKRLLDARSAGLREEATEQLGILSMAQGKIDKAIDYFSALITLKPSYATGYFHRGGAYASKRQWLEALPDARQAVALDGTNVKFHLLLGQALFNERKFEEAALSFENALNLDAKHQLSWAMLGMSLQRAGQLEAALKSMQLQLVHLPEDKTVYSNLIPLLMAMERVEEARDYLDKGLALNPNDGSLHHFKAVMDGVTVDMCNEGYVKDLFNGYAEEFDYQLQSILDYRTPELLGDALREVLALNRGLAAPLRMLDIGCGTGLGAVAMEDVTCHRVGVDIAGNMITKSRERGLYERLEEKEIIAFFADETARFDLVTAVDVFVYIGNIDAIVAGAHRVLETGGYFAFSVEREEDTELGYVLRPSGRFAHSRSYIESLAQRHGFTIDAIKEAGIRKERGVFLDGYLVIFRKR